MLELYLQSLNAMCGDPFVINVPFFRRFICYEDVQDFIIQDAVSVRTTQTDERTVKIHIAIYYEQRTNSNFELKNESTRTCLIEKNFSFRYKKEEQKNQYLNEHYSQVYFEMLRYAIFAQTSIGKLTDAYNNKINLYSVQDLIQKGLTK